MNIMNDNLGYFVKHWLLKDFYIDNLIDIISLNIKLNIKIHTYYLNLKLVQKSTHII